MYCQRSVAVVVPIHNEEAFIATTIRSIPDFVDAIIVVDDGSRDGTLHAITSIDHLKVRIIKHSENRGVGAATISGYSAISGAALRKIDLEILYPRYGFLNALLFSLLESNSKIASVPVRTVYGEEISGINPFVTVPTILYIILQGYLRRVYQREKIF